MRVVFAGTPEVALPALAAIGDSRHDLVAVVSRPDAPAGRSRRPVPSPVSAWAQARGIPLLRPSRPADSEFVAALTDLAPDCCPVVAYGALLPAPVLAIPRWGWVNVHFSLLPAFRGAAPVQRAIQTGATTTGVTVFDLVPALDAGPTYAARPSALGGQETAGDVLLRLSEVGAELLVEVLDAIEDGRATTTDQPHAGVSLAPKLTVDQARIDWSASAVAIDRLIRACNPSPMAWTTLDEARFRVLLGRPQPGHLAQGEVQAERREVLVGTGDGVLELLAVQPSGKRPMSALDWARGVHGAVRFG